MKLRALALLTALLLGPLPCTVAAQTAPPRAAPVPSAATPSSQADLALRLLREMPSDSNGSLSPVSLQTAFAMVAAGASETAREELIKGLLLPPDVANGTGALLEELNSDGAEVLIANRLWPDRGIALLPDYLKLCESAFGAKPQPLDYAKTENARRTINSWVREKTREKIAELIPSGLLDASTSLVLTNALYFRGDWKTPFDPSRTRPEPFQTPDGAVTVPMMRRLGNMPYSRTAKLQAVTLEYADSNLAMTLIVPDEGQSWSEFLQSGIDAATLREILSNPDEQKVSLAMPRFKARGKLPVIPAVTRLGVAAIFSAGHLSGISREPLQISDAVHEAVVEVDETGTVAAAATAVIATRSASVSQHVVTLDRPFMFVLHDTTTGATLFIGQIVSPDKAS